MKRVIFWSFIAFAAVLALSPEASASGNDSALPDGQCNLKSAQTVCRLNSFKVINQTPTEPATNTEASCLTAAGCYSAARSEPGQADAPIDVFTKCRYVDNNFANTSIFVPFRTQSEWAAFYNNAELNYRDPQTGINKISLTHCARPFTSTTNPVATWTNVPAPSYATAACGGSGSATAPNYYRRTGTVVPAAVAPAFSCHGGATLIRAQIRWVGLDSDIPASATANNWQPNIDYGPDVTLTASDWVAAGTPVTLTWTSSTDADVTAPTVVSLGTPSTPATKNNSAGVVAQASWRDDTLLPAGSEAVTPIGLTNYSITVTGTNRFTGITTMSSTASVAACPAGLRYKNGTCVSYTWGGWSGCSCGNNQTRTCNGSDGATGDPKYCGGGATTNYCGDCPPPPPPPSSGGGDAGPGCVWNYGSYLECDVGNTAGDHHIYGEFHCDPSVGCAEGIAGTNCWRWDSNPNFGDRPGCRYFSH